MCENYMATPLSEYSRLQRVYIDQKNEHKTRQFYWLARSSNSASFTDDALTLNRFYRYQNETGT